MSVVEGVEHFRNLDCQDQIKCAVAARVYIDMQLDKEYMFIDKCFNNTLDLAYMRGKRSDQLEIVLPIMDHQEFRLDHLRLLKSRLLDNVEKTKFKLAVCDTSSNILYYNVGNGFVEKL